MQLSAAQKTSKPMLTNNGVLTSIGKKWNVSLDITVKDPHLLVIFWDTEDSYSQFQNVLWLLAELNKVERDFKCCMNWS